MNHCNVQPTVAVSGHSAMTPIPWRTCHPCPIATAITGDLYTSSNGLGQPQFHLYCLPQPLKVNVTCSSYAYLVSEGRLYLWQPIDMELGDSC